MKQHVFLTCILLRKKSMNKKQQQMSSNCSLFITDFLLCSRHTRYILWSAHTIHLYSHNNHIWTELLVLHLKLYTLFFFDLIFFFYVYWERSSFFFFFLINFKEITICNVNTDLTEQQRSDNDDKADAAAAARKEI